MAVSELCNLPNLHFTQSFYLWKMYTIFLNHILPYMQSLTTNWEQVFTVDGVQAAINFSSVKELNTIPVSDHKIHQISTNM